MGNEHEQLIEKFYKAFANKDAATMISCYAEDIVFEDPAFGKLTGNEVRAMWTMLIARGKDLNITFSDITAHGNKGKAKWVPTYTFSKTGRKVVNKIEASFEFANGKIIKHSDVFDLTAWLRMAFGLKGILFAYIPFLKNKFRQQVKKSLTDYMNKHSY